MPVRPLLAFGLSSGLVIHALPNEEKSAKKEKLIKTADDLYDDAQYDEVVLLLYPECESENDEILWRLARAMFQKYRSIEHSKERLAKLEEAFAYVNRALEINEKSWAAHKWCAILMDYVWRCKSTKGRIIQSFEVKKHMERAIEINPGDSTSYYLLGEWCYTFADLPWYQRQAASIIFASPPTSTFEEAFHYFQEAERISPGFYSMNFLMMGKCLLKMDDKEKAITYLEQAKSYPVKTPDDKQAHMEAMKILKEIGVST